MPPKKAAAPKKDAKADPKKDAKTTPESSGTPMNACNFKVNMELMQEAGHYHRIKYDWWDAQADGSISTIEIDTGFFKDWNLIQVEGEERVSQLPMNEDEVKKVLGKGLLKKESLKKQPAKGAGSKVLYEEISDNRARVVDYSVDFSENGIPAMKVSELIAEKFQT